MTTKDDLAIVREALELADWTGFHKSDCDHGQPGACSCERAPWAALDRIEGDRQSWVDECAVLNTRLVNAEGRAYRYKARLAEAERVLREIADGGWMEGDVRADAAAYFASREQEDPK